MADIEVKQSADGMLRLIELVDQSVAPGATPTPVLSATVTANVYDADDAVIVGPLVLTQIGATNSYEILFSDTNSDLLTLERDYDLQIEADDGANRRRVFHRSLRAVLA